MKKNAKGFTLIELVIVIVIVGILAAVSVPIYKSYTRRAMAAEGRALGAAVANAQKIYFAEHNAFFNGAPAEVSAAGNKYFTTYTCTGNATTWGMSTAGTADAAGISVTFTGGSGSPTVTENGI